LALATTLIGSSAIAGCLSTAVLLANLNQLIDLGQHILAQGVILRIIVQLLR